MKLLNPQAWSEDLTRRNERLGVGVPREWLREGVRVEEELSVRPVPGLRDVPAIEVGVEPNAEERSLLVVRFPSGAVEFCLPEEERPRDLRSGGERETLERFRVELPASSLVRRGVVSQAIRLVLLRISSRLVDAAARRGLPRAARQVERWLWRRAGLREGWHRVRVGADGMKLLAAVPRGDRGRVLLLLHGTFSSTAASFRGLLTPAVMGELEKLYPGGVFGFEHFSFSRSLGENLAAIARGVGVEREGKGEQWRGEKSNAGDCGEAGMRVLSDWDNRSTILDADVVAYSRGGLLARMMVERGLVRCGRMVLCATPNLGTPLASGRRWRESLGWLANLLELCPDHPLIDGAELVARGAIWLATRLTADLPGLADMQPDAELLRRLGQSTPAVEACYALAANYQPEGSALERLLDLGSDRFFTEPNDLVVPTCGGWELGAENEQLEDTSIGCFGPSGNLCVDEGDVQHLNLLRRPECGELLLRALRGEPLGLPPLNRNLFSTEHYARRSVRLTSARQPDGISTSGDSGIRGGRAVDGTAESERSDSWGERPRANAADRSLQIMILGRPESIGMRSGAWQTERRRGGEAIILATYGGARVFQPFALSGRHGDTIAGRRFQRIISIHEKINDRLAGRRDRLPSARELRELGEHLFATLFSGPVKSLYDVARTEQGSERLNIIITCSIPWLAGKPWELAWDPLRRKFLATEDVHLVRSVFTAVPAERPPREQRPLRILIVEAQPADTAILSIEEERRRILHRFQDLVAAGAAEVSVLVAARPETLHERLVESSLRGRPFDIVHFIGHGDFDSQAREGCLLFLESEGDAPLAVGVQTLRELLCNRGLQLVFLNACDTARQPGARDRGIAQSLVAGGLPAVVANQFPVLDPSALAFAERFYWGLAQGNTLGAAAREARIAVNYSAGREAIDWAVPVLYARDPDDVLCRPPARRLEPLAGQRSSTSPQFSPRTARVARVGFADLSRDVTGLSEILQRMNAVQDYFEFRPVQVSVPLDVWRRERDASSGRERTFLVANELAEQLRGEVERLGVDYLACVTNWWVSESAGGDQNLLGWWSDERDCPVFVLSTAGLALQDNPNRLYRTLTNEFVACCGGFLHDAHSPDGQGIAHLDGPADSVFRYDPGRNPNTILTPLRIYEPQRNQLLNTLPRQIGRMQILAALDQLLASGSPP
jgi:pimeloyl-ACP methyl ester carboxylesterase